MILGKLLNNQAEFQLNWRKELTDVYHKILIMVSFHESMQLNTGYHHAKFESSLLTESVGLKTMS